MARGCVFRGAAARLAAGKSGAVFRLLWPIPELSRRSARPERKKLLDGLEAWLRERLRRHRGNADVLRQELVSEKAIAVSLRTVERAVKPYRQELEAEARATVRFETPPGKQMQIDFGERLVEIGRLGLDRLNRGNVGGSRTAGNKITETALFGWAERIRTSKCHLENSLIWHRNFFH
jgi:hypothetical protein